METPADRPDGRLGDAEVAQLADRLVRARAAGRTLAPISDTRALILDDAYRIQAAVTSARLARGERRVGWKLGYTSRAMRDQMGVGAPNFGPLTDVMLLPDRATVPATALQPRVEPEIAVRIGPGAEALAAAADAASAMGAGPSLDVVRAAVSGLHAALEVVDSVWAGYRFGLEDNTADGSSAAWVVIGRALPAERPDLVAVRLFPAGGEPPISGSGADADGDPLRGVAWLATQLNLRGERLVEGDVVITGGLTRAVPLNGVVRAVFSPPGGADVEVSVLPPSGQRTR